jgi:hypothetical protein
MKSFMKFHETFHHFTSSWNYFRQGYDFAFTLEREPCSVKAEQEPHGTLNFILPNRFLPNNIWPKLMFSWVISPKLSRNLPL